MGGAMRATTRFRSAPLLSFSAILVDLEKRVRPVHPPAAGDFGGRQRRHVRLGGQFGALHSDLLAARSRRIGSAGAAAAAVLFAPLGPAGGRTDRVELFSAGFRASCRGPGWTRRASPRTASAFLKARWPRRFCRRPAHPKVERLLSNEHLGGRPLLDAWASVNAFARRTGRVGPRCLGRNSEPDFHGERRRNDTHA